MRRLLNEGVTLVVDRYSFSGVAYSAAKSGLDYEWCKHPEAGLLKPDLVVFLSMNEESLKKRGGFGEERYENVQFQQKVLKNFVTFRDDTWRVSFSQQGE